VLVPAHHDRGCPAGVGCVRIGSRSPGGSATRQQPSANDRRRPRASPTNNGSAAASSRTLGHRCRGCGKRPGRRRCGRCAARCRSRSIDRPEWWPARGGRRWRR